MKHRFDHRRRAVEETNLGAESALGGAAISAQHLDSGGGAIPEHPLVHSLSDGIGFVEVIGGLLHLLEGEYLDLKSSHFRLRRPTNAAAVHATAVCRHSFIDEASNMSGIYIYIYLG